MNEEITKILDNPKKKFAVLASLPYEKDKKKKLEEIRKMGYIIDISLSGDERLVLFDEDEVIISIRGSDNVKDWTNTNSLLLFGMLDKSARYKREQDILNKVWNKYSKQYAGITLTGHSMGASVCYKLTLNNESKIFNTYCYNLGFSPNDLAYELIKRPFCKYTNSSSCRAFRKIHLFREFLDPVSILSSFLSNNQNQYNTPHGINNFMLKGGNIPETLTNDDIRMLISEYYPIHFIHTEAVNFPDSIENILYRYTMQKRGNEIYMVLNERIKNPQDRPVWTEGNRNLNEVPTYIFLRNHPLGFILEFNVLFHYNLGKRVMSTVYGSHFYDGTRSYIVFNEEKQPILIGCQYHSHKNMWAWRNDIEMSQQFNRRGLTQEYIDNHPVFYHSLRGNELLPFEGRYIYHKAGAIKLKDYGNKGFRYDTGNKYTIIRPEQYYGISNEGEDKNGNKMSLAISDKGLENWTMVNFIGREGMGLVNIPGITRQYRLAGFIHAKWSEYRNWEKEDKELQNYLENKRSQINPEQIK